MGTEEKLSCKKRNQQRCCCLVCQSVGHSEVTVIASKIIVAGPHKAGTFSFPSSSSSDRSGINPHTAEHSSSETKSSPLTQPPSPALIPPSSEPRPLMHKGTKGRRRAGEQRTKSNMGKKQHWRTEGREKPGCIHCIQSGSKALAFRKAPSLYVRDEGR